ncbi:MAG TPA: fused MFS/spermidine synthase [Bauldia sp.]|nr:fused MFS/spermidine synthase [Bauldia sp.]
MSDAEEQQAASRAATALVIFDVASLGFISLGFEMVASRILTPLFGGTIYTWATIISIVVAGLMAGYFIGGLVADRFPNFRVAAIIKLAAAAYLGLVFALADGSLEALANSVSGDIAALFACGVVVCFPSMVVMGMYSPLSVRLLLRRAGDAGKISGGLFAISSLGNIAGIIVTTFVLIPSVGTRAITGGFAAFLAISGLVSLAAYLSRRDD